MPGTAFHREVDQSLIAAAPHAAWAIAHPLGFKQVKACVHACGAAMLRKRQKMRRTTLLPCAGGSGWRT